MGRWKAMAIAQMSMKSKMEKHPVIHPCDGILLSYKMLQYGRISNSQLKLHTREYILYDSIYMKFYNRKN